MTSIIMNERLQEFARTYSPILNKALCDLAEWNLHNTTVVLNFTSGKVIFDIKSVDNNEDNEDDDD